MGDNCCGGGHFKGFDVKTHLKQARQKGQVANYEEHASELPTLTSIFLDSIRDIAYLLSLLILFPQTQHEPLILLLAAAAWMIFRAGRIALIGWARLFRLQNLIEDERFEIMHNRQEEKTELREIYRLKGLSGDLLEKVVETLMADDNRLLQVMLEDELGVHLEKMEHPLKQSLFAVLGSLLATSVLAITWIFAIPYLSLAVAALLIASTAFWLAKAEKLPKIHLVIWNLSLFGLSVGTLYFLLVLFL